MSNKQINKRFTISKNTGGAYEVYDKKTGELKVFRSRDKVNSYCEELLSAETPAKKR